MLQTYNRVKVISYDKFGLYRLEVHLHFQSNPDLIVIYPVHTTVIISSQIRLRFVLFIDLSYLD